jgi:ADP-ribosylglycohydrolase
MLIQDQFTGCLLGLALGDAMGAPFEGGLPERLVWKIIGKTLKRKMRWTDDTQMALDIAESIITNGGVDSNHLAKQFANSYRWSRGYGRAASKILKKIKTGENWQDLNRSIYPDGSYGNGASMRAPVIGIYFHKNLEKLLKAAENSALITHAHPLGIEGAVLIASATSFAFKFEKSIDILINSAKNCKLKEFKTRLEIAKNWLENKEIPIPEEVRNKLENGIAAHESCVTALYISIRFINDPFKNMLKFILKCGGDVDTIGAMAGAIWGTKNGAINLPDELLKNLESQERIRKLSIELYNCRLNLK